VLSMNAAWQAPLAVYMITIIYSECPAVRLRIRATLRRAGCPN
jgi:hypothetical protein